MVDYEYRPETPPLATPSDFFFIYVMKKFLLKVLYKKNLFTFYWHYLYFIDILTRIVISQ